MERAILCIVLCFLISCSQQPKSNDNVYFAGEIVNPTSDYVVLYKDDIVVDSAKLNEANRFSFNLENITEGLHHFDHTPELQYVYLEKGDSLVIRLNTVAFDESLVFSGSNEEVNNFLLEMFLNYEDEEQLVYSYYELDPLAFSGKIDSLRLQKTEELKALTIGENISENAFKMAKASIDYNSYIYKEKYPFIHKKRASEEVIHLYNSIKALQPNQKIPELAVQKINGDTIGLKDISKNNKTVFYFWTGDQKRHFRNILKHVKKLEKQNPKYQYVGINLRTSEEKWLSMLNEHSINKDYQFRSLDFEKTQETLIINNLSKCVITKDTIIVDAFANVFTNEPVDKQQKTLTAR